MALLARHLNLRASIPHLAQQEHRYNQRGPQVRTLLCCGNQQQHHPFLTRRALVKLLRECRLLHTVRRLDHHSRMYSSFQLTILTKSSTDSRPHKVASTAWDPAPILRIQTHEIERVALLLRRMKLMLRRYTHYRRFNRKVLDTNSVS